MAKSPKFHESFNVLLPCGKTKYSPPLGFNPRLTSVRCMLCLAHSPLNINKKSYRTCVCGDIETEIHLFFCCNFHDAARAILFNRVYNIVTNNMSPEFFDCLSNVQLLRIFLFGLPDNEPSHVSVAVFCAMDDFLKSCNKFWCVPVVPYELLATHCICFCVSICFSILFALLHCHSSTWHEKIAPVRLPPVARLSLNK